MASQHIIHCYASRETNHSKSALHDHGSSSLEQCRQLGRYAAVILKHFGRHIRTSANNMMFSPTAMCGSGMHALRDLVQAQKWGELARALDAHGETAEAVNGLLERANGTACPIHPISHDSLSEYSSS